MTKITSEHLSRGAFIYVRQSTPDQVVNNLESQRRQYGLADRARQLGWQEVLVIDDDLGRTGTGVERPGFEKLLAAICDGKSPVFASWAILHIFVYPCCPACFRAPELTPSAARRSAT